MHAQPPNAAPDDAAARHVEALARREERWALWTIFGGTFVFLAGNVVREHWPRPAPDVERAPERAFDYRVDLNAANAVELQQLPGIGPQLAERIVAERATRGAFATPRELLRVRGIGEKTLARILPHIVATPNPHAAAGAGRSARSPP